MEKESRDGPAGDSNSQSLRNLFLGIVKDQMGLILDASFEEAGVEATLKTTNPHAVHSGLAISQNAKGVLGDLGEGPEGVALPEFLVLCVILGPNRARPLEIRERAAIGVAMGCWFNSAHPEACIATSHYVSEGVSEGVNPEYEFVWTHHVLGGDPYCRFVVKKRGEALSSAESSPLVKTIPVLSLPKDVHDFWEGNLLTEGAMLYARSIVDSIGPERAGEVLARRSHAKGVKEASKIAASLGLNDKSALEIAQRLLRLGEAIQLKGELTRLERDCAEASVTECPFSSGVPALCASYESYWRGVIETIAPDYRYSCDKMMTCGERACHWTLESAPSKGREDPLKRLARKFVDGEITEEEFRKKSAVLAELYHSKQR
jgi:hypothetical protein